MSNHTTTASVAALLLFAGAAQARQELINNGGFESGLAGWSTANQVASDGTFQLQSGSASPVNGSPVPPPPQGQFAAMTDSTGPGSHVLYQDFTVPASVPQATLRFSLFIKNSAAAFSTPANLDFATPVLNQQARVDILASGTDPFSTSGLDVLQNLFQTVVGSPLVTGYNDFTFDVTALLAAHAGETLRLRFAEVDNVNFFNFGVDAVSLQVPAPSSALVAGIACFATAGRRRRPARISR